MAAASSKSPVRSGSGYRGAALLILLCLPNTPLLAADPPGGTEPAAEANQRAPEPRRQILGRKKLSPTERKKLEKERSDRLKLAEKFQKARVAEYQGWQVRKSEAEGFRKVLEKAHERFTLCLTRRW